MTTAVDLPAPTAERVDDAVQFAHGTLRDDILTGRLQAGAVLSQVQLAVGLGISRTPLREALRWLIAEGLVTGDFNRRMRVSQLNLSDFDQITAMRVALEPIALRATLPDLSVDDALRLAAHVDAMDVAVEGHDLEAFRVGHRAFHLGLTAGSGDRMCRQLAELWDHAERYRLRYLHADGAVADGTSAARLRLAQREHRVILAAAVARDVDGCSRELLVHLQRTLEAVFREAAPPPAPRMTGIAAGARSDA